jgi:hypothetical protein
MSGQPVSFIEAIRCVPESCYARGLGDRFWSRFGKPRFSTEPVTWFLYERQEDGRLHVIDDLYEHRTVFPLGYEHENYYGPSSLCLPIGATLDEEATLALVDTTLWVNWSGEWRRVEVDRLKRVWDALS